MFTDPGTVSDPVIGIAGPGTVNAEYGAKHFRRRR